MHLLSLPKRKESSHFVPKHKKSREIPPVPARFIADLELDDKVYKPDFELTTRYQGFSKELTRISLLGLGIYGFLLKWGEGVSGNNPVVHTMALHPLVSAAGIVGFAVCAICGLFHGFFGTKCLGYQLVISRYFGRLEGDRWDDEKKSVFREIIKTQQRKQRRILRIGNWLLWTSTVALGFGAVFVAICSSLVLFRR